MLNDWTRSPILVPEWENQEYRSKCEERVWADGGRGGVLERHHNLGELDGQAACGGGAGQTGSEETIGLPSPAKSAVELLGARSTENGLRWHQAFEHRPQPSKTPPQRLILPGVPGEYPAVHISALPERTTHTPAAERTVYVVAFVSYGTPTGTPLIAAHAASEVEESMFRKLNRQIMESHPSDKQVRVSLQNDIRTFTRLLRKPHCTHLRPHPPR